MSISSFCRLPNNSGNAPGRIKRVLYQMSWVLRQVKEISSRIPVMWYVCWTLGIIVSAITLLFPQVSSLLLMAGLLSAIAAGFILGLSVLLRKRLEEKIESCIHSRNRQRWYLGQGYRFIAWFSAHNLIWISLGLIVSGIALSAFGRHPLILSIAASLISCAIFSLVGIWWSRKPITLCICWPLTLDRIKGYWSRGCAVFKLVDRFDYARQHDEHAFYQQLIATWSFNETTESKGAVYIMPPQNPPAAAFRQEFHQRFISLSIPFLIVFLLSILLFSLIQRPLDNFAAMYHLQNLIATQNQTNGIVQDSQVNVDGGGENGQGQSYSNSNDGVAGGAGGGSNDSAEEQSNSGSDTGPSSSAGGEANEQDSSIASTNGSSVDSKGTQQENSSQDQNASGSDQVQSESSRSDEDHSGSKGEQSNQQSNSESTSDISGQGQELDSNESESHTESDQGTENGDSDQNSQSPSESDDDSSQPENGQDGGPNTGGEQTKDENSKGEASQDGAGQESQETNAGKESTGQAGDEKQMLSEDQGDSEAAGEDDGDKSESGAGSGENDQGTAPGQQEPNTGEESQGSNSMSGGDQNPASQDQAIDENETEQSKTPPLTDSPTSSPLTGALGQRIDLEVPALTGVGADSEEEPLEPQGDSLRPENSKFVPQRNIPQPQNQPLQWIPNWIIHLLEGF
ncbi:MAG: hypothetical protein JXA42_08685 [Anaerolineales bacterium]|nr:hypothetical protein [Anaerolineales bacterium]